MTFCSSWYLTFDLTWWKTCFYFIFICLGGLDIMNRWYVGSFTGYNCPIRSTLGETYIRREKADFHSLGWYFGLSLPKKSHLSVSLSDNNEGINKFLRFAHTPAGGAVWKRLVSLTRPVGATSIPPAAILGKRILLNLHKNYRIVIQLPSVFLRS